MMKQIKIIDLGCHINISVISTVVENNQGH